MLAKETLAEVPKQLISFFESRAITPRNIREDEKRKIQHKLSSSGEKDSTRGNQQPHFFKDLKEKVLARCHEMGMDVLDVNDFLEDKCIPENNIELILDYIKNPAYINPLRIKKGVYDMGGFSRNLLVAKNHQSISYSSNMREPGGRDSPSGQGRGRSSSPNP